MGVGSARHNKKEFRGENLVTKLVTNLVMTPQSQPGYLVIGIVTGKEVRQIGKSFETSEKRGSSKFSSRFIRFSS